MKNNTKIRLHLSKQLFESLAKQVIAEAKKGDMSGGAYTEAVKMPKEKKEKAPEETKTHKMKSMEEMETKVAEEKKEGLAKVMADIKSLSKAERAKLHAALGKHLEESPVEEGKKEEEEE